jgi:hypothetical protein
MIPRYRLDRKLSGPQRLSGRCGVGKKLAPTVNQTLVVQPVACRYTDLSWFEVRLYTWKVADSIPDEAIGVFNLRNPSIRTMALGSTQPLTEMSTRTLHGGKGRPAGAWG